MKVNSLRMATGVSTGNSPAQQFDTTRIALFGDYQDNTTASTPQYPDIHPASLTDSTVMGTVAFRHNNSANVAFLDGHVGSPQNASEIDARRP